MESSDLIVFGKLGNSGLKDGKFIFRLNQNFQTCFLKLKNFFLKYSDHRVRFVTISDYHLIKKSSDSYNKLECVFAEDDLEVSRNLSIAIAPEDFEETVVRDWNNYHIGKTVYFGNEEIGKVEEIIENKMQRVLVVRTFKKKEVLIPEVSYYVKESNKETLKVENIEQLLQL